MNFSGNPFDLKDSTAWERWRDKKLEQAPSSLDELIVEVDDPRTITPMEHEAIVERCRHFNMAIYASELGEEGTHIPRAVGMRFGCHHINHNRGAEADAVTALTVQDDPLHALYIPYTNRDIHWHTDGYYNRLDLQNHALLLHCVRPALRGGESGLMDHEMAYLLMREENPDYIHALMQEDVMVIPPHVVDGEQLRPQRSGPVFMVTAAGNLHMRYTMRKRNIVWSENPLVRQAVTWLENLLNSGTAPLFRATLQPGWGLICNNVLHDRTAFEDSEEETEKRLLYRARYYDRIHCS
ncbi:MAG: taurine catabolism dioxygenase TauD [Gammaproteobacteria bacterium]|jgi:hypothetical protein|nr:taurine catabolism dioxygenase TauD [Gammaproteobacteria bacterium]